jgi:hypothetical protein
MSWQAVKWVLNFSCSKAGSRLVLISIAEHSSKFGRNSYPSIATICRESNLQRRQVQYSLRDLEDSGEIVTVQKRGGSSGYSLPAVENYVKNILPAQVATSPAHHSAPPPAQSSAPEPYFNQQTNHKPRASRVARNSFDEEMEQRRKVAAREIRLAGHEELRKELMVGSGPR